MIEKTDFGDVVGSSLRHNCGCGGNCGYCNCSGYCNFWNNDSAEQANFNAVSHGADVSTRLDHP